MKQHIYVGILRILLGWTFLWAFIDKLFGLGFGTPVESAWIAGGSPTAGFLMYGTKGPFESMFQSLAGSAVVDWLFMIGLACIGVGLLFGIAMRLSVYSGITLMVLMYVAALLPEHNPIIDEHIIYTVLLCFLLHAHSEDSFGFGKRWKESSVVRKYSILR